MNPDGEPVNACGSALIGSFVNAAQFSFPVGVAFNARAALASLLSSALRS
jgi:hypothetical protein